MEEVQRMFIEPKCPECGGGLEVDLKGPVPSADDEVRCPVHGVFGTRSEMDAKILSNHDEMQDALQRAFNEGMKKAGF